jgi:hypothetical protein
VGQLIEQEVFNIPDIRGTINPYNEMGCVCGPCAACIIEDKSKCINRYNDTLRITYIKLGLDEYL